MEALRTLGCEPSQPTVVESMRAAIEAWNRDGVNGLEPFLAERVEWIDPPELPGGTVHRGRDSVMRFLREWEGQFGFVRLSFAIEDIREVGGEYLMIMLARGTGTGSGTPIPDHHWFHFMRISEGEGTFDRATLFLNEVAALAYGDALTASGNAGA